MSTPSDPSSAHEVKPMETKVTMEEDEDEEESVPETPNTSQTQPYTEGETGFPTEKELKDMSPLEQHETMVSHVKAFARGGVPGLSRLKMVFPNICKTFPDVSHKDVLIECGLSVFGYDIPYTEIAKLRHVDREKVEGTGGSFVSKTRRD